MKLCLEKDNKTEGEGGSALDPPDLFTLLSFLSHCSPEVPTCPSAWACWLTGAPLSPHTDMVERVLSFPIYSFVLLHHFIMMYLLLYWVHAMICV